ncbi:uncharacterized protein A4U43_C04F22730 [Asparagus officinalis]|uniref:Uncharacterized protein n=1 Tax=Asparagus officinalis TaxID=4686 RepID=A0A5P1F307_ASPOF|nr:uncharacterized protein A4U43_C04F22730 [Asparagus officinalis]
MSIGCLLSGFGQHQHFLAPPWRPLYPPTSSPLPCFSSRSFSFNSISCKPQQNPSLSLSSSNPNFPNSPSLPNYNSGDNNTNNNGGAAAAETTEEVEVGGGGGLAMTPSSSNPAAGGTIFLSSPFSSSLTSPPCSCPRVMECWRSEEAIGQAVPPAMLC